MSNKRNIGQKNRRNLIYFTCIGIGIAMIAKIALLQIFDTSSYAKISESQAIKPIRIDPLRGSILDAEKNLIVHSRPSFNISITKKNFSQKSKILLADIMEIDTIEINQKLTKFQKYSKSKPIKIYKDVADTIVLRISEFSNLLPGVSITVDSKRKYESESRMAHLLGYIGEINRKQLEKNKDYRPGDDIGKNGLESFYEPRLKGKIGINRIIVDKVGRKVGDFNNGELDQTPVKGANLILGIKQSLQQIAENELIGKIGSVVAMDVNTGKILAAASSPDYEIKNFTKKYNQLRDNNDKPLLNRLYSAYAPGSSWKMLVGLAALEEGIITKNTTFHCQGGMKFGNRFWGCTHTDGHVNVEDAIRSSCNVFFYNCGLELGTDKIYEYGKKFGIGNPTGIDLPYEADGFFYSPERLKKKYNGRVPKGIALNWGIGQGEISTTPLQMLVYTAALANGGYRVQPHLVDQYYDFEKQEFIPVEYAKEKLDFDEDYLNIVKRGMYKVVNEAGGTATNIRLNEIKICGKTSTAQNPQGRDHAWFVSFAPYESPEIAIVVMVENGGYGGYAAAPIAGKLYQSYFNLDTLIQIKDTTIQEITLNSLNAND